MLYKRLLRNQKYESRSDEILKRARMESDFCLKYSTGTESKGNFKTLGTSVVVKYS